MSAASIQRFALSLTLLMACTQDSAPGSVTGSGDLGSDAETSQADVSPPLPDDSEGGDLDALIEDTSPLDTQSDDADSAVDAELDGPPELDADLEDALPDLTEDIALDLADGAPPQDAEDAQEVAPDLTQELDAPTDVGVDSESTDPETIEDAQAEVVADATQEINEPDLVDDSGSDSEGEQSGDDLYNQLVHFEEVGVGADSSPVLVSQVIQIPENFESVEAQIAVRGDLDAFPMAFMALVVEQDGSLSQCGDLAGLPQKPNNLLDDIYRVGFPRPQNLDSGSVYHPPGAPYDYQAIPCQEAFANKTEVEIGIVAVGMYAPGVGSNQGPNACGGAGCPNDAIVKIRFLPDPNLEEPQGCTQDQENPCVCPDGTYGALLCEDDGLWSETCECSDTGPLPGVCLDGEESLCVCPDGTASTMVCESSEWSACQCEDPGPAAPSGACDDPYPFDLGPGATQEVTIALLGTALQEVPWPPFTSACPTSKPPFSTEYHYAMTVTEAGYISVSFEAIPEPWEITQFWLDMLGGCGVPYQCNNSWTPLEGYAEAGTYIVGLTVAPPNEIYIPEQDWWEFSITASWTPGDPPP